jgi:hypothetical protein
MLDDMQCEIIKHCSIADVFLLSLASKASQKWNKVCFQRLQQRLSNHKRITLLYVHIGYVMASSGSLDQLSWVESHYDLSLRYSDLELFHHSLENPMFETFKYLYYRLPDKERGVNSSNVGTCLEYGNFQSAEFLLDLGVKVRSHHIIHACTSLPGLEWLVAYFGYGNRDYTLSSDFLYYAMRHGAPIECLDFIHSQHWCQVTHALPYFEFAIRSFQLKYLDWIEKRLSPLRLVVGQLGAKFQEESLSVILNDVRNVRSTYHTDMFAFTFPMFNHWWVSSSSQPLKNKDFPTSVLEVVRHLVKQGAKTLLRVEWLHIPFAVIDTDFLDALLTELPREEQWKLINHPIFLYNFSPNPENVDVRRKWFEEHHFNVTKVIQMGCTSVH